MTGKGLPSPSAISALAFSAAILAAEGAFAFEGRYVAGDRSYRQELTITKRPDGRCNVTAVVGTEGCSGIVENAVGAAGDTLKAEGKEDDETCDLAIRRTKQGVSLEEDDHCIDFHGNSVAIPQTPLIWKERMTPDIGLANWFRQRALRTPERLALRFEGRDWTYAEMQRQIEVCASKLAALGIEKGERVAFLGFNQPMFFFVMFAAARLGAIFVPLNFRLTGPELAFMLDDCVASALIVDAEHRPVVEPQVEGLRSLKAFLSDEDEARWIEGEPPAIEPARVGEDDVAVIMYTSGTTGRPKGAMLTHGNFWWNNANGMRAIDGLAGDVTLTAAPIFHIGGLNVTTLAAFQKGALVVLHRTFHPGRALFDIAANKVTTMFGAPAMFLFMAQHPAFAETELSSLRLLIVGGAPCPLPLLKTYLARGVSMQQGYGLTETAPMVSFLAPEHALSKVGSSGRTPLFCEVKIVDSSGATIEAPRVQGEILVRGPNVTPGYWSLPEATAAAIDKEGWFRTGDAGFFDEERFLTISDRIKDMIITGGENVYPAEVESALMRHPAIAEVAVIGEPDDAWGEGVVAIAALKPGQSLTIDELRAFAGESLASYTLPKRLEIATALPRNATGKILKYQLRQRFAKKRDAEE